MARRIVRNRSGFSLLELLVVIAIIGVLIALSMGAIMRVRVSQQVRSSAMVVEKVQVAVDNQYKAIIAQAAIDIRGQTTQDARAMIDYFSGDKDTALAYLTYCRIRQSFPQTFAEVVPFTAGNYPFLVKAQFLPFVNSATQNPISAGSLTASQQSAALLYAAVAQTGAGGSTLASDETLASNQLDYNQPGATAGTPTIHVYKDVWNQPVGFCRFGTCPQLQKAPFINATATTNDPLDPAGKLQALQPPSTFLFVGNGDLANATGFDGTHRRPVVYSNGPNGGNLETWTTALNFGYESLNQTQALASVPPDDILGFQLTQLGQQGAK